MQATKENTLNGVNMDNMAKTVEALQAQPDLAKFKFRARNRAIHGGLNESEIKEFHGASQEHRTDRAAFVLQNDEPPVLLSDDRAPNPVEYVIHALLGCMTTTTLYKAAAKGIEIESVRSEIEGDLDLQGMLGLDPDVRPGYQELRAKLFLKTKGAADEVNELYRSSPVFDTLARPVPIKVQVILES